MKQKVIKLTKKPKLPTYKDIIKSKMSYKEINENSSIKNSIQKIKKLNLIIYQITIQKYLFLNLMNYHQIYY